MGNFVVLSLLGALPDEVEGLAACRGDNLSYPSSKWMKL